MTREEIFDKALNSPLTVSETMWEVYQQGRTDALYDLWNLLIGKYDDIVSLGELAEDVERIKEQKNE